jgi:uncharacterized hydrophobic protein (TIGR00271 family)
VTPAQVILVMLASLVALVGLAHNNIYIVTGAMLISPILGPIYAFSVLLALSRPKDAARSLTGLVTLLGAALVVSLAANVAARAAGYAVPATDEMLARASISWSSVVVPLLLGMASILAASSNVTEVLTGVAIAASIIPPAPALGWALIFGETGLAARTAANLAANVVGLLLGGYIMSLLIIARHPRSRKR